MNFGVVHGSTVFRQLLLKVQKCIRASSVLSDLPRRMLLTWFPISIALGAPIGLAGCRTPPAVPIQAPRIISRADWGAAATDLKASNEGGLYDSITKPDGWRVYDRPLVDVLKTAVIHHSALPPTDGPRQIQYKHMHERGFADIGYHFLIDQSGQIFEGRSIAVRGAHTRGHNTGTIGVALLGNFETNPPVEIQWASVKSLLRYLVAKYKLTHLAGHRDFLPDETTCPGTCLESLLPDLAAELGLSFGTAGYVGPAQASN